MGGRGAKSISPRPGNAKWSNSNLAPRVADTLKEALGAKGKAKSIGDAMLETNPHHSYDYKEYNHNCQRVVVAYEARRRGYDVTALPTYRNDDLGSIVYYDKKSGIYRGKWMGAFRDAKPVNVSSNGKAGSRQQVLDNIDNKMKQYGEGARGVVQIFYKTGGGHVFNVERKNGKTQYIEAQTGKVKDFGETLKNVKTTEVALVRTDNLKFSDRAKKFVTTEMGNKGVK